MISYRSLGALLCVTVLTVSLFLFSCFGTGDGDTASDTVNDTVESNAPSDL